MIKEEANMNNSHNEQLTIPTWRQIILPYETACSYPNPFLDVSIKALFTGPEGQAITREAYWDGGRNYKFAFAPTVPALAYRRTGRNRFKRRHRTTALHTLYR